MFPVVSGLGFIAGLVLAVLGRRQEQQTIQFVGVIGGLLSLASVLVTLARRTNIIRDASTRKEGRKPYSLARTQLAYWTMLVVAAYVFIWAASGDLPLIEGSTLALLGISIGTTAGARIIDSSETSPQEEKGDYPDPKHKRIQDEPSAGFMLDILSDSEGVSIHRFQTVVWSIVLGAIFVEHALAQHEILQFDNTLLALLGISNGAYVALKIPENQG